MYFFGKEVMSLFSQETRGGGIIPGCYRSGLIREESLKILTPGIKK